MHDEVGLATQVVPLDTSLQNPNVYSPGLTRLYLGDETAGAPGVEVLDLALAPLANLDTPTLETLSLRARTTPHLTLRPQGALNSTHYEEQPGNFALDASRFMVRALAPSTATVFLGDEPLGRFWEIQNVSSGPVEIAGATVASGPTHVPPGTTARVERTGADEVVVSLASVLENALAVDADYALAGQTRRVVFVPTVARTLTIPDLSWTPAFSEWTVFNNGPQVLRINPGSNTLGGSPLGDPLERIVVPAGRGGTLVRTGAADFDFRPFVRFEQVIPAAPGFFVHQAHYFAARVSVQAYVELHVDPNMELRALGDALEVESVTDSELYLFLGGRTVNGFAALN